MAARINRRHQDMIRDKIQAVALAQRLEANAMGQLEKPLESSQVRSIEVLLKKVLPDLSAQEVTTLSSDDSNTLSDAELMEIARGGKVSPIKRAKA